MHQEEAIRQEAERLKRSIWFLLSFANIAERTAHLPAPVRFVMLAILRLALGAGQRLVAGMAEDLGLELAVFEPDPSADSIDELFELARAFRILGCLLGDLAAWAGYFDVEPASRVDFDMKDLTHLPPLPQNIQHSLQTHPIRAGPLRAAVRYCLAGRVNAGSRRVFARPVRAAIARFRAQHVTRLS